MKKQILTFTLLATVAISGAFASNANTKTLVQGRPFGSSSPCNVTIPCHPDPVASCTINGQSYGTTDPDTGLCTQTLALD